MAMHRIANTFRQERRAIIIVFFILLACYSYFFPRWASWNQNSRLDLVMAIVDHGTLSIDEYYQNTGDYAVFEGHHYSTKAPGSSFLGVPVYWVFGQIVSGIPVNRLTSLFGSNQAVASSLREGGTGILPEKLYTAFALYAITFSIVSVPSALLGVILYLFLGHFTRLNRYRLWLTLTYGLATIAFPYAGNYFGHQIVATLLFASFYLLFLMARNETTHMGLLLLVGFLISYAVITEYPVALVAAGLFLYGLYKLPNKLSTAIALIVGGIPPIIAWMMYNYLIYHTPIAFGYLHTELYLDKNNVGFFSLTYPHFEALWGITFGSYRGLFFLCPVLLLAIPGFYYFFRKRELRAEFAVSLYSVIAFFLFNGSSVMWEGGFAVGPRYLVPILPFMVLPIIFFINAYGDLPWIKGLVTFLTTWSVLFVWAETIGGQSFPDWTLNPLVNYSLPKLMNGDIARNIGTVLGLPGWFSLLPLLAFLMLLLGLQLSQSGATQKAEVQQTSLV